MLDEGIGVIDLAAFVSYGASRSATLRSSSLRRKPGSPLLPGFVFVGDESVLVFLGPVLKSVRLVLDF